MTRNIALWRHAAALLCIAAPPLVAQTPAAAAGPQATVTVVAENISAREAAQAGKPRVGPDSARLRAGDVIEYRLRFSNTTREPVKNVVLEDPLPAGLIYVGGTAAADVDGVLVEYSIDGGRSFAATPMVRVMVDGQEVERPAPPERYTNIRWRVAGSVNPGARVTASFRARFGAGSPQ